MAGLFDEWDAKRERAERPAAPAPTGPVTAARATAYALAALQGEVANIAAVPIGSGRNDQLNKSALKMFGLAEAGAIDHATVESVLGAADGGLDYPATRKTLASAREAAARNTPRVIPDSAQETTKEAHVWNPTDDPFADHERSSGALLPASSTPSTSGSTVLTGGSTGSSPTGSADPFETVPSWDTPSTSSATSTPTATPSDSSVDAPVAAATSTDPAYVALVQAEAGNLRLRRDARRLVDHEDAARDFRVPPSLDSLADELALPDEPVTYAVDELFPTGANVLLTAQYKTGKTTLVNNLVRSLVDGLPFLGRYGVNDVDGRVAIFNYEVDGRQYRRWLRDVQIEHPERVALLNLRGYRLPLMVPHIEAWVVEWLKRHEVAVWVVDPFARAAVGSVQSENDNTEVGAFLDTLDVIKDKAGVSELILPTHTGRGEMEVGEERARGATRLDDWADVRWLLTKDKHGARFFRATGRDVDTDESALEYDERTRVLSLTGGSRWEVERVTIRTAILTVVRDRPGLGTRDVRAAARAVLRGVGVEKIKDAVDELLADHELHTARNGHTVGHYLGPGPGAPFDRPPGPSPDPFEGV